MAAGSLFDGIANASEYERTLLETYWNQYSAIPFLSTAAGAQRIGVSCIFIALDASSCLTASAMIPPLYCLKDCPRKRAIKEDLNYSYEECSTLAERSFNHLIHDIANLARGSFELVPIVGNILLWSYDQKYRFLYNVETV